MQELAENPFGTIPLPTALSKWGTVGEGAIGKFLNVMLRALIVGAGIYALVNLILAGYQFMSSAGDPKGTAAAWAKIWQTFLGLTFAAGAFLLAAIFGKLIFNQWDFILNPRLITPP